MDTRDGVRRALTALAHDSGRAIDIEGAVGRLGVPMAEELGRYFADPDVQAAVVTTRRLFLDVGVPACIAIEGAAETLAALLAARMGLHVVTSRHPEVANAMLRTAGLLRFVSGVDGMVFGSEKVPSLLRLRPLAFVGDHPADMDAAVKAKTVGVGVTTGNHDSSALIAAGADSVVDRLTELRLPGMASASRCE